MNEYDWCRLWRAGWQVAWMDKGSRNCRYDYHKLSVIKWDFIDFLSNQDNAITTDTFEKESYQI